MIILILGAVDRANSFNELICIIQGIFPFQSLLELHSIAGEEKDAHLCSFVEENYLDEQVKAIRELSDLLTKMKRAGDGVGLHIIDKELAKKS